MQITSLLASVHYSDKNFKVNQVVTSKRQAKMANVGFFIPPQKDFIIFPIISWHGEILLDEYNVISIGVEIIGITSFFARRHDNATPMAFYGEIV